MKTKGIIAVLAAGLATALFATSPSVTWYVDASASAGGSGLSSASAFPSISEAVAAAASGDTIRIAAGVYRENVVIEGKSLTIVGAGREATVIDANRSGRPFAVTGAGADGTRIKSLQLLNGLAGQGGGLYVNGPTFVVLEDASIVCCSNTLDGEGAAVYGPAWVVRTLVERCDTPTSSSSVQRGVLSGVLGAVNSVFVNNGHKVTSGSYFAGCSILATGTYGPFVNCNFIHNFGTIHPDTASYSSHASYVFRNCLSLGVETRAFRQSLDCQYCAQSTSGSMPNGKNNFGGDTQDGEKFLTERTPVVSTLDDWHLTPGSQLIDQGLSAALTQTYTISGRGSVTIPEEFVATDYYGASRIQGGVVDIGAAEGPVANMSGIVFLDYSDRNFTSNLYVNCRRSVCINVDPKGNAAANGVWFGASGTVPKGVSLVYGGDSNIVYACHNNQKYPDAPTVLVLYYPDIKGRMTFAIPSSGAFTNAIIKATAVKYVDPAADASLADGTAGHPYRTLQAASDAASAASAQYTIIRAKEGVYAEGGSQGIADSDNVCTTSNRVYISGKNVHLVGAGPGKSIIMGKKVAGDSRLKGCGPGAMRCVQVSYAGRACITGFTLTGGATDSDPVYQQKPGKTGDVKIRGNFGGGGLSGRTWCNGTRYAATVQNCIISNNVAYFGAGVYAAACRNSILAENETVQQDVRSNVVITAAGGSAAIDSICSGCVVYGNRNCTSSDGAVMSYNSDIYCFDTTFGPVSTGYKVYDTTHSFTYNCLSVGLGLIAGTQSGNVSVGESTVEPVTLRPYLAVLRSEVVLPATIITTTAIMRFQWTASASRPRTRRLARGGRLLPREEVST